MSDETKTENQTAESGNVAEAVTAEAVAEYLRANPNYLGDLLKTADKDDPAKQSAQAYVNKLYNKKHKEAELEKQDAQTQVDHWKRVAEDAEERAEKAARLDKQVKSLQEKLAVAETETKKVRSEMISDRQRIAINDVIASRVVDDQVSNAVQLLMAQTSYAGEGDEATVCFDDGTPLLDSDGNPSDVLTGWLEKNPSLVKANTIPGMGARGGSKSINQRPAFDPTNAAQMRADGTLNEYLQDPANMAAMDAYMAKTGSAGGSQPFLSGGEKQTE